MVIRTINNFKKEKLFGKYMRYVNFLNLIYVEKI